MEHEQGKENHEMYSELFNRISHLRNLSVSDMDKLEDWSASVYSFDKDLKNQVKEHYEDRAWWSVSEWHNLTGSTPEIHPIKPESKRFIIEQINKFVENFENKWEV